MYASNNTVFYMIVGLVLLIGLLGVKQLPTELALVGAVRGKMHGLQVHFHAVPIAAGLVTD